MVNQTEHYLFPSLSFIILPSSLLYWLAKFIWRYTSPKCAYSLLVLYGMELKKMQWNEME